MPLSASPGLQSAHALTPSRSAATADVTPRSEVAASTAHILRRNSMGHEDYSGNLDAVERRGPYGRVTTRECRLLQRLLPHQAGKLPKSCADLKFPVRASSTAPSLGVEAQAAATSSRASLATPLPASGAAAAHAISKRECEKLADVLLTEIHGGGAFLPVSCRRVELQKRRLFEREEETSKLTAERARAKPMIRPRFTIASSTML